MAGKHIGATNTHRGSGKKEQALHTAILQWVAVLFLFDTICPYSLYTAKIRQIFLFSCTHLKVGAFFVRRKMALTALHPGIVDHSIAVAHPTV